MKRVYPSPLVDRSGVPWVQRVLTPASEGVRPPECAITLMSVGTRG